MTDDGKQNRRVYQREYQRKRRALNSKEAVQKRWVQGVVAYAKKYELLIVPDVCEICNIKGHVQGHHPDYAKPLEVIWLCPRCHTFVHSNDSKDLEKKHSKRAERRYSKLEYKLLTIKSAEAKIKLFIQEEENKIFTNMKLLTYYYTTLNNLPQELYIVEQAIKAIKLQYINNKSEEENKEETKENITLKDINKLTPKKYVQALYKTKVSIDIFDMPD